MAANNPIIQCSLISCMQKVVIYETKSRYYVVGSNNTETRFRVLKLDRSEQRQLIVVDDKVEYSAFEIQDLLHMIDVGNRSKSQQKGTSGLSRTISAFGIVGFVRFLEGYYVILITKRRQVALLGPHTIYKIEDTKMVYIPHDSVRYMHPEEQRYVKMFQSMDLSSNFYFSYSYDLTHTLQYNMAPCSNLKLPCQSDNLQQQPSSTDNLQPNADCVYGVRTEPNSKYAWNWYVLKEVNKEIHSDWLLYVLHGFIAQSNIDVFGRPIYLTLIARRSRKFAGTRFLKRGANSEGDVANEVETEQIVYDASVLSLRWASVTAFVQLRASIPAHWSQDVSKMVPKPTIIVDQLDPFAYVAGLHFDRVLQRYGSPVIILDLVKRKEKKRREVIASEQMVTAVEYLNQFLAPQHNIKYISFDMARVTKNKKANVFSKLAEIAEYCVKKLGYFKTGPRCHGNQDQNSFTGAKQRGVVRTNCIDCLDRTNTAQFAIGKCVLAHQLYGLGVLDSPSLQFDTDCVRMLEDLYEDHGDTLALQYGGSQLVHRIKGYRKVAPWTSSSRDIMQTLSRCYSNAFSDADRQQTMNLFLGVFIPKEGEPNIWELSTDFYLHNPVTLYGPTRRQRTYSQWWDSNMISCLPDALEQAYKGTEAEIVMLRTEDGDERVDGYSEYYHPHKLTVLEHLYSFYMHNSIRDFMPKCVNSYSPFALRVRPGRRHEQAGVTEANPNVSGKDSTSSCTSAGSDASSSSDSDFDADLDDMDVTEGDKSSVTAQHNVLTLKDRFPTMCETYGIDIQPISKQTLSLYKWFVQIGQNAGQSGRANKKTTHLIQRSVFPLDCSRHVEPPAVSTASRNIYETYVMRGKCGAQPPNKRDMKCYHDYVLSRSQSNSRMASYEQLFR